MTDRDDVAAVIEGIFELIEDRQARREALYATLKARSLLSRVTTARYLCPRRSGACVLATVFRAGNENLIHLKGHRFSPARAADVTDPEAAARLAPNGQWPARVLSLDEMIRFRETGPDPVVALVQLECPHFSGTLDPADVLANVEGRDPGRPGRPVIVS